MQLKPTIMFLGIALSTISAPITVFSATKQDSAKEIQGFKEIDAKELKSWLDSGKQFQIVDARPKKYDEGDIIPGAKFLPYDSDTKTIAKILPEKDKIIVAYCASVKCPASKHLSEKLIQLGYQNVYKYPGGIDEWMDKGYPTEQAKK